MLALIGVIAYYTSRIKKPHRHGIPDVTDFCIAVICSREVENRDEMVS